MALIGPTSVPALGINYTAAVKASDTGRANSTIPLIDPGLFFTTVNNAVYDWFLVCIYVSAAGGGTPDIKCAMAEDATARGQAEFLGLSTTDTIQDTSVTCATGSTVTMGTAATNRTFRAWGTTIGAGGSFGLFWAQATSGANPTTVLTGSTLYIAKVH